jgi:hypothetical protein
LGQSVEASPALRSRDRARAGASWPRCGAYCRSTGEPCRAEGSGVNGLCPRHCGLVLPSGWREPRPTWELLVGFQVVLLKPSRVAHGRWPAEQAAFADRWPQRIRRWVAVRLVSSGQVARAVLLVGAGQKLLAEIRKAGVRVVPEHTVLSHALVRVRFESCGGDK